MPTPRQAAACVTAKGALVVAGGSDGSSALATVEVMNIDTKQWTTVSPLPQKQSDLSGIVRGDSLYLAGGSPPSKSVFTCSLPDLLSSSNSLTSRSSQATRMQTLWKEVSSLPAVDSTLASFGGHLLAIGGKDDSTNSITSDVFSYDSHTNSWSVVSQMKVKRSECLAVILSEDHLIVVGGYNRGSRITTSVEILQ